MAYSFPLVGEPRDALPAPHVALVSTARHAGGLQPGRAAFTLLAPADFRANSDRSSAICRFSSAISAFSASVASAVFAAFACPCRFRQ